MKKNVKWKYLLVGFILGSFFFTGLAYAATSINVDFVTLKYYFDGVQKSPPADQPGFIYNGRTYVPLRFVCESLGKEVDYDGSTNSIYIGDAVSGEMDLVKVQPIDVHNIEKKTVTIGRETYTDILWLRNVAWVKWNLDGKYTKLTLTTGYDKELVGADRGGKVGVMLDGKSVGNSDNLTAETSVKEYTFDLTGKNVIELSTGDGFSNSIVLKAVVE